MKTERTQPNDAVPADLNTTIHAPKRLAALAILRGAEEVEFSFLQERLDLAPSDLSKQMATLVDAGFAASTKTGHGRGSTTWYRITGKGQAEFDAYRKALRAMLDGPTR